MFAFQIFCFKKQVGFKAKIGRGKLGDIAIDNITMVHQQCTNPVTKPKTTTTTTTTTQAPTTRTTKPPIETDRDGG